MKNKAFRFSFNPKSCNDCDAFCCKGEGHVFLDENDIERISNHLHLNREEFLKLYTKRAEYINRVSLISIKTMGETRCVFLNKDNRCEIYPVRPKQCKSFPFWENLKGKNVDFVRTLCPYVEEL